VPLFSFEGRRPIVHETAWIAPTASIIGDVIIEADASIWFNAVLRSDFGSIVVRAGANVQDGSVLHSGPWPTVIGSGATIGHLCMVHSASIGEEALIANGAVVLDGAVIGDRALIAAGATVAPNTVIPAGMMAFGTPAIVRGPASESAMHFVRSNPEGYRALARRYAASLEDIDAKDSARAGVTATAVAARQPRPVRTGATPAAPK
jgi:carbonic anhydrase/acetyltransferase-like protein (isoleucine patch superfamily)